MTTTTSGTVRIEQDGTGTVQMDRVYPTGIHDLWDAMTVPDRLARLGAFYPTPGYCDELMNFYRAEGLRSPRDDEHAEQDADEDIEVTSFARDALKRMVADGDIIDLKTIAGLALV